MVKTAKTVEVGFVYDDDTQSGRHEEGVYTRYLVTEREVKEVENSFVLPLHKDDYHDTRVLRLTLPDGRVFRIASLYSFWHADQTNRKQHDARVVYLGVTLDQLVKNILEGKHTIPNL